jgi:DNA polymerase-3 subunit alpha
MASIPNYIDRKFGREEVTYHHPMLEPILSETYGILVYQEQIIQIASQLAGYTTSEADLMRRAVGKKKKKDLDHQHEIFVKGAAANGIPEEVAERIFADIDFFANYGFNKSHGAAYAVITLQTAYLKAHYPVEFMAALLSVERGNLEKVAVLIAECRRLGIEVRPPDISRSQVDFSVEPVDLGETGTDGALLGVSELAIRYGLGAIKNVGGRPGARDRGRSRRPPLCRYRRPGLPGGSACGEQARAGMPGACRGAGRPGRAQRRAGQPGPDGGREPGTAPRQRRGPAQPVR